MNRSPCGCGWDTTEHTFVFQPCSRDCPNLRQVLDIIQEQGKELGVIQDPELGGVPLIYRCPGCGKVQDAQTSLDGNPAARPGVGDLGVCWYCSEVFRFTEAGPVSLDAVELVGVLAADQRLAAVVTAIRGRS